MSSTNPICLMAEYNEWMNARLYEAAKNLPIEELNADRKAFFGSILGTLNHLVVADTIWLKRFAVHPANYTALDMIRDLPTPKSLDQMLFTDIQSLAKHRKSLDQAIMEWAHAIAEHDLDYVLCYSNMKGIPAQKNFFSLGVCRTGFSITILV
ncbi:DinB family protein [Methylobacter sp. YRD-M1]|uniref:DinB family protein n=1 Tax=Methylobacter sp. YRD-M1 TaxID=2911520 RepID=UPI00227B2B09|nr:DinB family protein [Methylobacter sp. YRD-M1]WAK02936.1 damage-inducible protein DinB [Methylobacter sp. YRD-M1]